MIQAKKKELAHLEEMHHQLTIKTRDEFILLCKLEDKTPVGQVLKQKSMLRNLVERYQNQRNKKYEINYIDNHKDFDSKQRKLWKIEDKIKSTEAMILKKIATVTKVSQLHGDHGDSLEYILKEYKGAKQ